MITYTFKKASALQKYYERLLRDKPIEESIGSLVHQVIIEEISDEAYRVVALAGQGFERYRRCAEMVGDDLGIPPLK